MQFRSDTDLRVPSLSGHIAIIGNAWRDLPLALHGQAVAMGAEFRDDTGAGVIQRPAVAKTAVDSTGEYERVLTAIKQLLITNDPADFTNDGPPKLASVSKVAGFTASKALITQAWAELATEAAKAD